MNTTPILFWPKARSEIELHFDRGEADFLVVDTNCTYDLQRLYKLQPENLILDPFPDDRGELGKVGRTLVMTRVRLGERGEAGQDRGACP